MGTLEHKVPHLPAETPALGPGGPEVPVPHPGQEATLQEPDGLDPQVEEETSEDADSAEDPASEERSISAVQGRQRDLLRQPLLRG